MNQIQKNLVSFSIQYGPGQKAHQGALKEAPLDLLHPSTGDSFLSKVRARADEQFETGFQRLNTVGRAGLAGVGLIGLASFAGLAVALGAGAIAIGGMVGLSIRAMTPTLQGFFAKKNADKPWTESTTKTLYSSSDQLVRASTTHLLSGSKKVEIHSEATLGRGYKIVSHFKDFSGFPSSVSLVDPQGNAHLLPAHTKLSIDEHGVSLQKWNSSHQYVVGGERIEAFKRGHAEEFQFAQGLYD